MKVHFTLSLLVLVAACAGTAPSPQTRVRLVRDETRVDPKADEYICERETSLGSNIIDVRCRHRPELDMDHKEPELLLQRPMGVGQVTVQTNTMP